MQAYLKGHQSKNKKVQKRIKKSQRRWAKLVGKRGGTKKKPKKKGSAPVARLPYPCGPKQMAIGDPPPPAG